MILDAFFAGRPPNANEPITVLALLCLLVVISLGHACIWISFLDVLYSRPLPKIFLKFWRFFTGFMILAIVPSGWMVIRQTSTLVNIDAVQIYLAVCLFVGGVLFPLISLLRLTASKPRSVIEARFTTIDYWKKLGRACVGDGFHRRLTTLPGNDVFAVDFMELTLRPSGLPHEWDGLKILFLSDLHFHGTPSREFFDALFDDLAGLPKPDLIVLGGDYVDTDTHHEWLAPLLGKLKWNELGIAVLGNHDNYHEPDRVRHELEKLGYLVPGNSWREVTIRGVRVVVSGNERPWFTSNRSDSPPAEGLFHLCVSHSPDQFYWAVRNQVNLMFCGHVHGGGIRLPVIGSLFVPSRFGRRFDQGVFSHGNTTMIVGRGVSGKEPLRIRCRPEVIQVVLRV